MKDKIIKLLVSVGLSNYIAEDAYNQIEQIYKEERIRRMRELGRNGGRKSKRGPSKKST